MRDWRRDRLGTVILSAAILVAPFLAWLFNAVAGLLVMAVALGSTTYLLLDVAAMVSARLRPWLRLAIVVNLVLAGACVLLALWLLVGT